MRSSQALFRRSIHVAKSRPALSARQLPVGRRLSTTPQESQPSPPPPTPPPEDSGSTPPEPPSTESALDKPKFRRTRVSVSNVKDPEPLELPENLDVLWTPQPDEPAPSTSQLPPPENFEDALNKLLISLHPQTQHRAAYASSSSGTPTEPTLGLYCPIEGGDYIIDATVRELARRTGAEVLVLDAVQLAAGEWGEFGAPANSLSLNQNPLHFPSAPLPSPPPPTSQAPQPDEQDDMDMPFTLPRRMTLAVIPPQNMQNRTILATRRSGPASKIKVFFDTLVNLPSQAPSKTSSRDRPRLIYIRDFPTLAASSASWYPPLLSAVRQRRRGPISRPSSPVSCPMTIIFGMTPSIAPPTPSHPSNSPIMRLLTNRTAATPVAPEGKPPKSEWSESEHAEKARERRLKERLRKWERGDSLLIEEMPELLTTKEGEEANLPPDVIVIGSSGLPLGGAEAPSSGDAQSQPGNETSFFRTSILIPETRSVDEEKAARIARRREINELTMRMGVGEAGGILEQDSAADRHAALNEAFGKTEEVGSPEATQEQRDDAVMWDHWGNRIEPWANVRRIADRAIGNTLTMARLASTATEKPTLDSTIVPWSAVHKAWATQRSTRDLKASWLKDTFSITHGAHEAEAEGEEATTKTDEVVERIKNDTELDPHEEKLLPCIVDAHSMPTSFDQVHLPHHTIDSVRTLVSLPLLHPQAFQQGILKDHGMTGCLLFGPPGTGKTLIVRALAKEAGCRMLTISPSDVMDMYVGEGEKLVKAVFSLARRLSPCVVFLDEIDALFGARMSTRESGGAFAHRGVITEFMQEMDGLKSSKEDRVIVIGATNRPFDLDDAVLRRLPRRLLVDLPGEPERQEILKILLRNEKLGDDVDVAELAKKTESFSGSDLKHLCVSAALDAVKEHVRLPWITTSASAPTSTEPPKAPLPDQPIETTSTDAAPQDALSNSSSAPATETEPTKAAEDQHIRVLHLHNFTKALKEITPSSSESLGSLAELRKWNDEFGEGQRDRKKRAFWGKGRFGFTDKTSAKDVEGHVLPSQAGTATPGTA